MSSVSERVEKALESLRPYLMEDGGDVEFVRFEPETGVIEVRLLGMCSRCPMSMMTLRAGIERYILRAVPEAKRVENVR